MGLPKKDPNNKLKELVGRRQEEFASRYESFDKTRKERTGEKAINKLLTEVAQLKIDPSKLAPAEFPATLLAQIRQCVQLLAHDEDKYKATSITVLAEIMMRFPVLVDCVVNNILSVYNKPRKLYQRQAKLLGIGCVFRYGLQHVSVRVLQRLVAEIVLVRHSSNKDDMEVFFLITALQEDSKVAVVSHLIVEGMSGDLARPISSMKPTMLWLRVVLAERMMALGLKLPVWLHDTFLPKQVDAFGEILLPKSQKLATNHPVFANFIDLLASYYQQRSKQQLVLGLQPIPSPVLVFFKDRIAPTIINCYRLAGKKTTFEIAYRLLMSILSCQMLDLDTMERVVQWSVAGEGLNFFLTMDKRPLKQALCRLILSYKNIENDYERSRLALCVLQGSLVVPKLRHIAQERLKELNQEHAHNCVNNAVNQHWGQRLSERESGLMLKLVTLPQCCGDDSKMWRQQVAEGLARRALRWTDSCKRQHIYVQEMTEIAEAAKAKQTAAAAATGADEATQGGAEAGAEKTAEEAEAGAEKTAEEAEAGTEKMAEGEHEGDATVDETQKAPWEQPLAQFTEKPIMSKGNRRAFQSKDLDSTQLFFRFLVHASQDHETIFHILISAFNTAAEEIKKDPEFLRLDSERYDCFKKLNTYMQILYKGTQKSAKLRFLLQVILSQLGLELLLKCARDTEDIIQDFIPCIQQYLDEEGHVDVMTQQEKGEQLLQEYEEKAKEWEKEEQRIRRRKKREMQRQMKEEEGDANLIPLPGQEAPVMPDFSSKNDASDVDDSTNESDHDTDNEKTTDETEEQLTKVGEVSGDEQIDDIDDNSKCEERENEAGSEETEKRCGSDEEEDGVLLPCGGESKWLGVLVDVLLALCTRGESWWRVSLKPTAFLLAGRMTSELLSCVTEVLFNEDLVQSNKKTGQDDDDEVQDREKAQEEEEKDKESDNESDDIASGDNEKVSAPSSKKKQDDEESDEDDDSSGDDESEDSGLDDEEGDDVDGGAAGASATVLANKHKNQGKINLKTSQDDPDVNDIYSDDSDDEEEEDGEDDDDSQDEEDDDDEDEEVELETSMKQSKLDEMKSALFRVLGPTGPDDAVEEDMDKVPPEELRALNIQLGAVLGSYIKKKTNNNPNALSGVTADIVQFRNRALDIVEGLIDGPLPCELLLRELMLPLLQTMALHAEERMTDLNNRIRKAIQHIREKKKYINVGDMSIEKFQECLAELFDVAKVVPEAKHGFVTLIRCSAHFCREKGIVDNPIIPAYIGHAKNFIRNPNVEGTMVLEPLFLEIPELRTGLCRGLVEEIFSPVVEEEDEEDFKVKCRRIFEKKKEYPNNYPVLDGKMTSVWLFLEALYSRILPNVDELTEDERWTVEEVVKHIVKFTKTCTQPKLKDVAIINFVLKIILRYPCGKACVDWEALCKTLFQYRVRMSRKLQGGKGVKMELKKLLDTSLRSQCPYALSILKDRKDRKRQRQVTRKEKKEAKKQELSDVTTPAGARARKMAEAYTNASKSLHDGVTESIDDLFKPNAKRIDEDDPEMDVDERLPQKRKREEEAEADILRKAKEIRASKTALNRKKRQSRKLSKKCKKAALAKLKEMEKELKLKRVKVDVTENNVTPKTVERIPRPVKERKPKETDDSLQMKDDKINRLKKRLSDLQQQQAKKEAEVKVKKVPEKLIIKANRKKADAAMNKELQPGLFKYCNKDMCDD